MTHQNIGKLLNPQSLAIAGPNDKNNAGAQALANARASGFSGPIYPINPNYELLQGLKCYPSLSAVPTVPDTLVVAVPTLGAMKLLREAESVGVPSIVFFNGGFLDSGNEAGHERHNELMTIAGRAGMAVAGPNCMGLLSRRKRFDSSFIPQPRPEFIDGISIVSQSGGLLNAFVELATNRGIGFNYLISSGNEAVLSTADYLEWLTNDRATNTIVCVIEGLKDGARFRSVLEQATRQKPVVILKLGRSDAGQSVVMAHTGSLAGSDATFAAMCAQCGSVLVDTVDAALETAAMFNKVPLPQGDRVVMFSGSGGATALATDLASGLGLKFNPLAADTNARLQEIFQVERPFINPFDVGAYPLFVKDNGMQRCLEVLSADDTIDLIGCVLIVQRDLQPIHKAVFSQMAAAASKAKRPIVLISEMTSHWRDTPPDLGVYATGSLQEGLVALRGLADYAAYRRRVANLATPPIKVATPVPKSGRGILTEFESKKLLGQAGMPVTREVLTQTIDQAIAAAIDIGFPVALKVQSPNLMHKTDAGALALNISNELDLRLAFQRLVANAGDSGIDGLLLQEMVHDGVEFLLGMHRDAVLGPVVVLSPGGVFVELFEQSATLRLPPFGADVAESMIDESNAARRLLGGFRSHPPADRDALVRLICEFSVFVVGVGEHVASIDLNPVLVLPRGNGVMIVDAAIEFTK